MVLMMAKALGRGHGGTAIFWSKNLKASDFQIVTALKNQSCV